MLDRITLTHRPLSLAANRSQILGPRAVVRVVFPLPVCDSRLCSEKTPAIQEVGPSRLNHPITARGGDVLLPGNRPRGSPIAQLDSGGLTEQPWAREELRLAPCDHISH